MRIKSLIFLSLLCATVHAQRITVPTAVPTPTIPEGMADQPEQIYLQVLVTDATGTVLGIQNIIIDQTIKSTSIILDDTEVTAQIIKTLTNSDGSIDDADAFHTHSVGTTSAVQWNVDPLATTTGYTFTTQTKRIKWALLTIDDRLYEFNSGDTIRSATNPGFDPVEGSGLGTHGGITVSSTLPWTVSDDDPVTATLIYQLENAGLAGSGAMFWPSMLVRAGTETITNPEPALYWGGTTMTVMRY